MATVGILGNVIVPIILLFLIILVILLISGKSEERKDAHYDEMQLKIRADGYRIGFCVTIIGLFLVAFLTDLTDLFGGLLSDSFCLMVVGFAGIVSFTVYCIFKDSFYFIGQNRKRYVILCGCLVIANGISAFGHIIEGTLVQDGTVTFSSSGSLICAVSFLIILIALMIKEVTGKEEADE